MLFNDTILLNVVCKSVLADVLDVLMVIILNIYKSIQPRTHCFVGNKVFFKIAPKICVNVVYT